MKKAVIYIRVSTTQQVEDGVSLDTQAAKLKQYCELNDLDVVEIISDNGISGKTTNRPGFQKVMNMRNNKSVDVIAVYSLSRFARNTIDTLNIVENMNKKAVSLYSFTEKIDTSSAIGRFFLTTLASLAQLEREQLAERTKAALQYKKSNNERIGQIPFGKQLNADGTHLENNPNEQQAIKLVFQLRSDGLSYAAIASELERRNIANKAGLSKWNKSQIFRIIKKAA